MAQSANWLDDVIVLNESSDPTVAGDVQIYRNGGDLGRQLEHWYVDDVEHLALTGTGQRAVLGLRGELVVVERVEPFPEGPDLLRAWLDKTARHILSVRKEKAGKRNVSPGALESEGVLPATIEGLIAYIGFVRL